MINVKFFTYFNKCNFNCEYCIAADRDLHNQWDANKFNKIVKRICATGFGDLLNIRIDGKGELLLSKTIINGIKKLSHADSVGAVNIVSGIPYSGEKIISLLDGCNEDKVKFVASVHPTQIKDMDEWIKRVCILKEKFDIVVACVCYPPIIDDLFIIKEIVNANDIKFLANGFIGWYEGRKFPEEYTQGEKALIRGLFYSRHDFEFSVNLKRPGMCNAGHKLFYLNISGHARKCGKSDRMIGNILEGDTIMLSDKPMQCQQEFCVGNIMNMNTVSFCENYRMVNNNIRNYEYIGSGDEWTINQ